MPKGQFKRRYQTCDGCRELKAGVTAVLTQVGGQNLCIQCKEVNRRIMNPEYRALKEQVKSNRNSYGAGTKWEDYEGNKKPLFTTKHYKAIASIIAGTWRQIEGDREGSEMPAWRAFTKLHKNLEMEFHKDNPKFHPIKFKILVNKS